MKSKRGAIELEFKWVFELIAGVFILLLVVMFINVQRQTSEEETASSLLNTLDAVISVGQTTEKSVQSIRLGNNELEFDCETNKLSIGRVDKALGIEPVFAHSGIKGRNLIVLTKKWPVPFLATNFLYFTSDEARYVFVDDNNDFTDLYNQFPDKVMKEKTTSGQTTGFKPATATTFIFFNKEPVLPEWAKEEVTALKVMPSAQGKEVGSVAFYKRESGTLKKLGESDYYGAASLYGAFFSDDKETYDCGMERAFSRLALVSQSYSQKIDSLKENKPAVCNPESDSHYDEAKGQVEKLKLFGNKNSRNVGDFKAAKDLIEAKNSEVVRLACPSIY